MMATKSNTRHVGSALPDGKGRRLDPGYADTDKAQSVYSDTCAITLRYEHAACKSCGIVQDILNGYCPLCRGAGANERQCLRPEAIRAGRALPPVAKRRHVRTAR